MTLYCGVDTGSTYTDAVLMQDETRVVASAKALTTRDDLARGIGAAIGAVLNEAKVDAAGIGLVSLSTTLATNALVQGQGDPVCLVFIGFSERDIARQALDAGLNLPVIGLGASAQSYYPALGKMLNCKMILPKHAGVANAIGAVVGQISMRESGVAVSLPPPEVSGHPYPVSGAGTLAQGGALR